MRIKYRREALDQENNEIELAKETKRKYTPYILEDGDTEKQLLPRNRFLLFKSKSNWTASKRHRAEILFNPYSMLDKACSLAKCY
jgi:hypothetical protein